MPKQRQQMKRRGGPTRQNGWRNTPSTGAVTTKHEVAIQVVDFFDYTTGTTGNVTSYWWDNRQNLFNNNSGPTDETESFCRVRALEVYALPRRGIDVNVAGINNAAAMYSVNCQTPGLANGTAGLTSLPPAQATNTQVTNVLPQFDTKWKKVFSCNLQKTFESSVIRPFTDGFRQCLFQMAILDPTNGEPIDGQGSETVSIRVKVVLHIDQPINPIQQAKFTTYKQSDLTTPQLDLDGVSLPAIQPAYCQMDVKRILDRMR